MLKSSSLKHLRDKKNLLAFSGGVDSTALFFLLLDANISFDIAIVNYGLREQSKEEVAYAKELTQTYKSLCFTHDALNIDKNFEAKAREVRYNFFDKIIQENSYDNLLTAHHLGDRFEWMLMQFCKGAGCVELAGMQELSDRETYTLIRPLLHIDKSELLQYLNIHNIKYFQDTSNFDTNIKRNNFRHNHTNPMLKQYLSGVKKSFDYIDNDLEILKENIATHVMKELNYFQSSTNITADIRMIDKLLKSKSYLLSASERILLKSKKTLIVGRKFLINQEHGFVFILPFIQSDISLPKEFKEHCRVLQIEPKLRPYLYQNEEIFVHFKQLLLTKS